MNIQDRIESLKPLLAAAQDGYVHAIAAGDWEACSKHKNDVARYQRQIGQLIKQKLAAR